MPYGAECWTMKKKDEMPMNKIGMRMLRWIQDVSLREHNGNEEIRKAAQVQPIAKSNDFIKNNQIKEEHRVLFRILGRWKGYFDKLLNGENHRFDPDGVPNDGLTQRIGRNEVLKSKVITHEERRDIGNGWDSRICVDVVGRRRD